MEPQNIKSFIVRPSFVRKDYLITFVLKLSGDLEFYREQDQMVILSSKDVAALRDFLNDHQPDHEKAVRKTTVPHQSTCHDQTAKSNLIH